MSAGSAVAVAVAFSWLGMVAGLSFIEAPLKFRAPGVTLPIGLGIGRLVFRALNTVEAVFALCLLVVLVVSPQPGAVPAAFTVAIAMLVAQVGLVRPRLNKRSDLVLGGYEGPRSRVHYVYVALEMVKLIALLVAGILLLAG